MKYSLLLLAAVGFTAATYSGTSTAGLKPNREYHFKYDSQVLSGIPVLNFQYSGLKIKSDIVLQKAQDEYVTMKLKNPRIFKVKERPEDWESAKEEIRSRIDRESDREWDEERYSQGSWSSIPSGRPAVPRELTPTQWMPESLLEELPSETSRIVTDKLDLPIKFKYRKGIVTKVYADGSDPYWSVNIKKGVISMLYLDLYAANQVTEIDTSRSASFLDVVRPDYTAMSDKTGFKVKEPSTIGDCETYYSIVPDITLTELKVKKVPDTKKCSPKIVSETGVVSGLHPKYEIPAKEVVIQPSITTDYLLSGSRHEFTIKKAILTAKYTVSPSTKTPASLDSFVMQQLVFEKEDQIERELNFETTPVLIKSGIKMYLPLMAEILGKEIDRNNMAVPDVDIETKIEMIDGLLEKVVEKTTDGVDPEATEVVRSIMSVLRKLSKEELLEVVNKYFDSSRPRTSSTHTKKRDILLDMIPRIPTPKIGAVVKHMVKEEMITGITAAMTINAMTIAAPPSPTHVSHYLDMIKEEVVRRDLSVMKSTFLGLGSVTNKMTNVVKKTNVESSTIADLVKTVVKEMKSLLRCEVPELRELAVKAMGNLGVADVLSDLERVVKDKSEDPVLRNLAIYSMMKPAHKMPKVVRSILLPIYLRPDEKANLRTAAFIVVMETRPKYSTLHVIASSVNEEKNPEVASFVYSYLQNVARIQIPEMRPIKTLTKKALAVTRPITTSPFLSSKAKRYEAFSDMLEQGMDIGIDTLSKKRSVLPYVVVARQHQYIFGENLNVGEIGVWMHGIDKIVRKVFGTEGVLSDVLLGRKDLSSIGNDLSRPEFSQIIASDLEDILSKIDLSDITREDFLNLGVYFRFLENEMGFTKNIDKTYLGEIIEKGKALYDELLPRLARGIDIDYTHALELPSNAIILATPIGLPLSANITMTTVTKVKGRVALEGFQSILSVWNGNPVKVKTDIRPTIAVDVKASVGFVHDLFDVGTAVKVKTLVDLPIDIETEVNIREEKVVVKFDTRRSLKPKVVVDSKPIVYTLIVPTSPSAYVPSEYRRHLPRSVEIDGSKSFKRMEYNNEVEIPVLRRKLYVRTSFDTAPLGMLDSTIMCFLNKQRMEVGMEPTGREPEKIVVKVKWGEIELIRSERRPSSNDNSWFNSWFGSDSSEEFEELSSTEFMPITPKSIIDRPTIKKIRMDIESEGSSVPINIKNQIAWVSDPSWLVNQINYQVIAEEMPDLRPFKVMVDTVVNIPKAAKTFMSIQHPRSSIRDLIGSVEVEMGTNSFTENKVSVKVFPYLAQEDPEIPTERGLKKFEDLPMKSVNVKLVLEAAGRVMEMRRCPFSIYGIGLFKAVMPDYTYRTEALSSLSSSRKTVVAVQVIPTTAKANVVVATPYSTNYMLSWDIASIITPQSTILSPVLSEKDVRTFPSLSYMTKIPKDLKTSFYGICKVRPSHIETIDKLSFAMADIDSSCEMVLAHDCSEQKLYTIISSPVTERGTRKIKMLIPMHKVEVLADSVHTGVILKINGEITSVTSEPLIRTYTTRDGRTKEVLKVKKIDGRYIIKAPEIGLKVETDGRYVDVHVSPLLTSRLCGLCSYMPKTHAPIYSPVGVIPEARGSYSMRPFIKKFLISSPTCPASTETYGDYNEGTCNTVSRNIVVNRPSRSDGRPQICISVRPVEVCSDFCHAKRTVPTSIGFHCMDPEEASTKTLLRERHERVLNELTNRVAHIQENVDMAIECGRI